MANWIARVGCAILLCVGIIPHAHSIEADDVARLLAKAENLKTSNNREFVAILEELQQHSAQHEIPVAQQEQLRYLQGWQYAYTGEYDKVTDVLKPIIAQSQNSTLKFRAHATLTNVLAISSQHEAAYAQLGQLIELLPQVEDRPAREQGLIVTALLYNQARQYDLGLQYANMLVQETLVGRSACIGGQLRLEALHRSQTLTDIDSDFHGAIQVCEQAREPLYANLIRTYMAERYLQLGRHSEAIELLDQYAEEAKQTKYPMLVSSFDVLLALSYRAKGDTALARRYAMRSLESGVKNEYTRPMAVAYGLLYEIAKEQGDLKSALNLHEKFSAADKGYLNDLSARGLAYQRVTHEVNAGKLMIEALNKQNQVLQLQQALSKKAVENIRLYIALLTVILVFIALWAYKTKRSQMHFMKLSRLDGLTGIYNRPHFIELAESILQTARKSGQNVCVVLCDLDHFKTVNDNFGHAEGDNVLQRAVTACQTHLRATDVFARIGGEEFGMLFQNCSVDEAFARAERLRIAVIDSNPSDRSLRVSASFGISSTSGSGYDLRILMTHADAALYQAKHAGRNRVVIHGKHSMEVAAMGATNFRFGEIAVNEVSDEVASHSANSP